MYYRQLQMARGDSNNDNRAVDLSEFAVLVRAILADGKIHESERRLVRPQKLHEYEKWRQL
jgi:uncharacterized tellurite resistance protein B-like protein